MRKKVGLYLGVNSVGVAVVQAKDIEFLGRFEFSSLDEGKIEALTDDIRWESLINKALREARADQGEVYVSMADRDFIVRSLEMPLMKRSEVESSLVYEIEKYIPFKMSELEWAYEYVRFPKEKRINISFIGIKENNLHRIREILARLNINAVFMEPSCLSLERSIKALKNFSKIKDFAFLDFSESESYLTFFQHGLPVFNRYLVLPKKEGVFDAAKFVDSVDFSFQYFRREYKAYQLEKFIIIGDIKDKSVVTSLHESLQTEVVTLSPYDLTARDNSSVEAVKALGAASRDFYPTVFKPVFKKTPHPAEALEISEMPPEIPMLRIGLMTFLVVMGAVFSFFLSVMMGNEVGVKKQKLEKKEEKIVMPIKMKGLSWEQREELVEEKKKDIDILRGIHSSFMNISEIFAKLHRKGMLPEGVWLVDLSISRLAGGYQGTLKGYIFRDDDYQERLGLNELVSRLKQEDIFMQVFSNVELDQSRRQKIREFEVTSFTLKLR